MNTILRKLTGGDLRSEGRSDEVAAQVVKKPALLPQLADGLASEDRLIRARTCMTMEIISRDQPKLLDPVRSALVDLAIEETVAQARWHLGEIFANTGLPKKEAERVIPALLDYLEDRSKIVRHCAILALGVLGADSPKRRTIVRRISARREDGKSMARAVDQALERLR